MTELNLTLSLRECPCNTPHVGKKFKLDFFIYVRVFLRVYLIIYMSLDDTPVDRL